MSVLCALCHTGSYDVSGDYGSDKQPDRRTGGVDRWNYTCVVWTESVSGGRLVLRCGVRAGIIYVDTLPLRPDRLLHKAHTADNARGTLILLLIF